MSEPFSKYELRTIHAYAMAARHLLSADEMDSSVDFIDVVKEILEKIESISSAFEKWDE